MAFIRREIENETKVNWLFVHSALQSSYRYLNLIHFLKFPWRAQKEFVKTVLTDENAYVMAESSTTNDENVVSYETEIFSNIRIHSGITHTDFHVSSILLFYSILENRMA